MPDVRDVLQTVKEGNGVNLAKLSEGENRGSGEHRRREASGIARRCEEKKEGKECLQAFFPLIRITT